MDGGWRPGQRAGLVDAARFDNVQSLCGRGLRADAARDDVGIAAGQRDAERLDRRRWVRLEAQAETVRGELLEPALRERERIRLRGPVAVHAALEVAACERGRDADGQEADHQDGERQGEAGTVRLELHGCHLDYVRFLKKTAVV